MKRNPRTLTLKDSKLVCKKCGGFGFFFPDRESGIIHTKKCDACGGTGCAPVTKAMFAA